MQNNYEFQPTLQFEKAYFFMLLEYFKKECWEGFRNTQSSPSLAWLKDVKIANVFYEPKGFNQTPFLQEGEKEKYCIDLIPPVFQVIPERCNSLQLYIEADLTFEIAVAETEQDIGVRNMTIDKDDPNYTPINLAKNSLQEGHQMLPFEKLSFLRSWLVTALLHKRGEEFFSFYPEAKKVCFYGSDHILTPEGGLNFFDPNGAENIYADRFGMRFNCLVPTQWYGSAYTLEYIDNLSSSISINDK